MTGQSTDPSSKTESNPQPTASELAGIEKKFLRLTFWQTVLSVAGVFTGAVALYAALSESQAVRQQTSAAVWPYVELIRHDTANDETASFALSFNNVGVGPARMQGVRVELNGRAVPDWQAITEQLQPDSAVLGVHYGKSDVSSRVLAPGESLEAFQTDNTELALAIQQTIYSGSLTVSYCYCSIFDECWQVSGGDNDDSGRVEETASCPDLGVEGFRN